MIFFPPQARPMDEYRIMERLLAENAEFRRLHDEHRDHEIRLLDLSSRPFLTDEERVQERELKKLKLVLKDKMYRMMKDLGSSR